MHPVQLDRQMLITMFEVSIYGIDYFQQQKKNVKPNRNSLEKCNVNKNWRSENEITDEKHEK